MTKTTHESLLDEAREAAENAHAPYSQFRVGSVVVDADGHHHLGVNVENAAYGATTCAEANAVAGAIAAGARTLQTIAVVCLDGSDCFPCGNCRQVMREFGVSEVIVETRDGTPERYALSELLPHDFSQENLEDRS